jgi:pimeloyl-ACP methyl ester carboxylesterase
MKRYLLFLIITALLLIVSCAGTPDPAVKSTESPEETTPTVNQNVSEPKLEEVSFSIAGIWMGKLEAGGTKFTIVFKIEKQNKDQYTGSWDSPDQKMTGMPVDSVTTEGNTVHLEMQGGLIVYEGIIDKKGEGLAGTWKQSGLSFPLVLSRVDQAPTVTRPQDPIKPYPYEERAVCFINSSAGVTLAGTLTIPSGTGTFPAVLLVTGSGPQNRNEEIFNHKPFLVLADYLTRKGVAVLRYDDRGAGESTGDHSRSTIEDFAGDTYAGFLYLREQSEIDPDRIGILGHSEGGIIAPLLAARYRDIAFIVMLAGPGLSGDEILYLQNRAIAKASGISDETIEQGNKINKLLYTVVKSEQDFDEATRKIESILKDAGMTEEQIKATVNRLLTPYFRFFLQYDPQPALRDVQCPVLALIGGKDLQVPPKENIPALEKALYEGGNSDYTVLEIEGLNHLFQTADTGLVNEYAMIDETIAPDILQLIALWILEKTR